VPVVEEGGSGEKPPIELRPTDVGGEEPETSGTKSIGETWYRGLQGAEYSGEIVSDYGGQFFTNHKPTAAAYGKVTTVSIKPNKTYQTDEEGFQIATDFGILEEYKKYGGIGAKKSEQLLAKKAKELGYDSIKFGQDTILVLDDSIIRLESNQPSGAKSAKEVWLAQLDKLDKLDREAYEDLPEGVVKQKIKVKKEKKPEEKENDEYWERRSQSINVKNPITKAPLGLLKREWNPYSRWKGSKIKVYQVDGNYIRSPHMINGVLVPAIDTDFTMGGHWKVYDYVPENEVWIERMKDPMENKFNLIHEIPEVFVMDEYKMPYLKAHDGIANPIEQIARKEQDPKEVDRKLEEVLDKFADEAEVKRLLSYKPKVDNYKESEPELTVPRRYYLGRKLRPMGLRM
jgi:hypothetical protein